MIARYLAGPQRPSLRWVAAGLVVAVAAAAAGWAISNRIATRGPDTAPPGDQVLTAGPARLRVSVPWAPARRPPALPGLDDAPAWTPYAGISTTVSVKLLPAQDAALLPTALIRRASKLPAPETAKVVGLRARAYRGVKAGDAVLDVYAIPTTRGVLTLACTAPGNRGQEGPTWCLNGLEEITVTGAMPLKPAANTAYRLRSPSILARLDRARVRGRRALHAAKRAAGQGRAAAALASAYRNAAAGLRPLAPESGAAAAVPPALSRAAAAYGGLARAAGARDRRRWNRARRAVHAAEVAVKRRVAAAT